MTRGPDQPQLGCWIDRGGETKEQVCPDKEKIVDIGTKRAAQIARLFNNRQKLLCRFPEWARTVTIVPIFRVNREKSDKSDKSDKSVLPAAKSLSDEAEPRAERAQ